MVRYFFASAAVLFFSGVIGCAVQEKKYAANDRTLAVGKDLFTKHCTSCHGLQHEGIGPPLGGITRLLSEKELLDFIRDPAMAIASGEERAVAQFNRYKLVMPSFDWMPESDIRAILKYLNQQTQLHQMEPAIVQTQTAAAGLTGRLVAPIQQSDIKMELEEVVQLPRLGEGTNLGVVTLRAHPSGDGTLFASDQHGVMYRIKDGKATVFLDLRTRIMDFQSGPGIATGLGSFDFHPDFLNNGLLYISNAETYKGQKADYLISDTIKAEVQWVLGEWKMDRARDTVFTGKHRELLRLHAPTFGHGLQDIGFVPGLKPHDPEYGLLYFGFGDGGSNNIKRPELGHHLRSFLGTIMRIDPAGRNSRNGKYGIPADNPFVSEKDPGTVKEIYALGFRNPHRVAWDPTHGNRMMATDIGEANIEELNIIQKGGDYGWPSREGNFGINPVVDLKSVFRLSEADLDLFKKPFIQYDHKDGNAISGGYVYDGDLLALQNKYIFGDIVTGSLFYLNIDQQLSDSTIYKLAISENGKETSLQEMSQTKRLHLRVAYDQLNKQLYIITKHDGKIRRVVKAY
jgi:glucose/arabinose dehydrogenase